MALTTCNVRSKLWHLRFKHCDLEGLGWGPILVKDYKRVRKNQPEVFNLL